MGDINVITRFTDAGIVVQGPYDELLTVPGLSWSRAKGAWCGDLSPSLASSLLHTFAGRLLCNDAQRLKDLAAQTGETSRLRALGSDLPDVPNAKLSPWPHQKLEYWAMVKQPALLAYLGLGTGKTAPVVWYVQNMHVPLTLVVCPLSVIDVWLLEFPKHATVPVTIWPLGHYYDTPFPAPHGILLVPLNKGTVEAKAMVALEAFKYNGSVVIICNFESSWRSPLNQTFPSAHFDLLVLDEGHKLQSPGSRVSKFFHALGKTVPKRVALTGTPCPNGPLTIYGLYRSLDSGIFGTSFARFRDEFAVMGGFQNYQVVEYKNVEEYNRRFYSIAIHADRSVLSLPPAVTVQRTAALSPSALKIYKSLEKDLVAQIENGTVTAANGLVKLLRLSQLTGGWLSPDVDLYNAEAKPQRIDTAKQELLADVLDDLPKEEPVVVFYKYVQDAVSIREVCKEQGRKYSELSGRVNELAEWQKGGQVLAAQIASGSVGVDMTRSCYAIYYSMTFSLSDYEQSLARIHRPGQDRAVTYINLVMSGTVDEKIYAALAAKKNVVEEVLRDMGGA
jgi:SNF2 family DNA or RNA helicase